MNLFCRLTPKDGEKENRRKRMEVYIRNHWGEEEIDLEELIHVRLEHRGKVLSTLPIGEKVMKAPDGSKDFVVFVDLDGDLDFITDFSIKGDQNTLIAEINAVENQPTSHLPQSEFMAFKRILGGAIVCAIEDVPERARAQLNLAKEYLKKRTTERSRLWMLSSAFPLIAIIAVVGCFFPGMFVMQPEELSISPWIIGLYFGMLGAFFSILQRSGRRNLDSASGRPLHLLEICVRFAAGAIAGLIIIYISISPLSPELFHDMVYVAGGPQVLGFLAGFSDQLIPSIVSKYQTESKS